MVGMNEERRLAVYEVDEERSLHEQVHAFMKEYGWTRCKAPNSRRICFSHEGEIDGGHYRKASGAAEGPRSTYCCWECACGLFVEEYLE